MSNSIGLRRVSRTLYRSTLSTLNPYHRFSSTTNLISDSEDDSPQQPDSTHRQQREPSYDRPLENGIGVGIYKAILVGEAGQKPFQKTLKSGMVVTMMSLGTGGIRNNRRPLGHESPSDYANRCAVQWHRVSIYPQMLGNLAMKHVVPGSILYVEGNLETKIFSDPVTGLVRQVREVAVRRTGRIVFLSGGGDADQQKQHHEPKAVGYF